MGGYFYPDQFTAQTEMGSDFAWLVVAVYLMVVGFSLLVSLASYVMQSWSLYAIARRRGIRNPWLGWLPVGNLWILGSISDQYQYLVKGKLKNRRKALLILGTGVYVLYVLWLINTVINAIMGAGLAVLAGVIGGIVGLAIISIAMTILYYMALYDLYRSCQPDNGVLYLVLSILFQIMLPIFMFVCRKKDLGMPPRKQPAPEQIVAPIKEPVDAETIEEGYAFEEEFEEE